MLNRRGTVKHPFQPCPPGNPVTQPHMIRRPSGTSIVFCAFYWAFVTRAIDFENLVTLWGLLKPGASQ